MADETRDEDSSETGPPTPSPIPSEPVEPAGTTNESQPVSAPTGGDLPDFWPTLSMCQLHDGAMLASPYPPDPEWYPDGIQPYAVAGDGTGTYGFMLWRCERLVVDNLTVEHDRSIVILYAAANAEPGHPNGSKVDAVMVEGYTDSLTLAGNFSDAGFPIHFATVAYGQDPTGLVVEATTDQSWLRIELHGDAESDPTASQPWRRLHHNVEGAHRFLDAYGTGNATGLPQSALVTGEGGAWSDHVDGTPHEAVTNQEAGTYQLRLRGEFRVPPGGVPE